MIKSSSVLFKVNLLPHWAWLSTLEKTNGERGWRGMALSNHANKLITNILSRRKLSQTSCWLAISEHRWPVNKDRVRNGRPPRCYGSTGWTERPCSNQGFVDEEWKILRVDMKEEKIGVGSNVSVRSIWEERFDGRRSFKLADGAGSQRVPIWRRCTLKLWVKPIPVSATRWWSWRRTVWHIR